MLVGPFLAVGGSVFPGGQTFFYYNPLIGSVVGLASLAFMIGSSYFFGKEWGVNERIIFAAGAPAVTFFLLVEAAYALTGGYHGTGGGADFLFLWIPVFIFLLGAISAAIGGSRKRGADRPGTGHTADKMIVS